MCFLFFLFFFKQKTAYEMRISDWSSDVCSSDLARMSARARRHEHQPVDAERRRLAGMLDRDDVGKDEAAIAVHRLDHFARPAERGDDQRRLVAQDRKSTRLNSSH